MAADIRTVHVKIEGRVQGVGFRAWTYRMATELRLEGWVRNRTDGAVEAVFQGPGEAVDNMLDLCRDGPSGAIVTRVDVLGEGVGVFEGFDVRPTS
jgi:acylphosphatase